ncbi:MAG: hypothetical protein IKU10_07250 [Clostridia bacterium]|nr:hypothetical protein [Clostridia bacterium]
MKSKKRAIVLTLTLILLIGGLVSATLAYFTDNEFNKDNIITIGNVEIDLFEHSEEYTTTPDHDTLVDNDAIYQDYLDSKANLLPGEKVGKYTYIENTGKNPAYVRFTVTVPEAMNPYVDLVFNTDEFDVIPNGNVYTVVRKEALPAGEVSGCGLETVALKASLTEEQIAGVIATGLFTEADRTFNITVSAEAIQTVGFNNYTDAFAAFDANPNEKVDA